jgi:putative redox protein
MEMMIDFPGGARVDAHFGLFTVATDQPPASSAPAPFDVFLASIGTCAGIYVLGYCRNHGLPMDGIKLIQKMQTNPASRMVEKIDIEIQVPPTFPKDQYAALIRAAELCKVKKHIAQPPVFEIYTKTTD